MQHRMELPEYIEGIPTAKNRSAERRNIIKSFYINLLKMFQREGRASMVFNEFLGVDVYIKQGESDKKTINGASSNWKSTWAVRHLIEIITYAHGIEGKPVYEMPKDGTQKKNGYKNIAVLYHTFENNEIEYLNFTVKLTVGIKADNKHVQYCVNKIEV